jgi:four helix bundle suffix protein
MKSMILIKDNGQSGRSGQASTRSTASTPTSPTYKEIAANAALILIAVACSLLDRQIEAQADAFEREGGFTERLYRTRKRKLKNGQSYNERNR